jgi:regulator of PEP synthase PpsR (kinase-PPPase family)
MEDIMEILQMTGKRNMMNTVKRFHVYNETKLDNQISDKWVVKYNTIFDTIMHKKLTQRAFTAVTSYTCLDLVQSLISTLDAHMHMSNQPNTSKEM